MHADSHGHASHTEPLPPNDDTTNQAMLDARTTMLVVLATIAAWAAAVYFFVL